MPACSACGDTHPDGTATCPVLRVPVTMGPCGTQVDRYEVMRWIGGGGMGAVYRARHATVGSAVALKLLHPRFATDADAVARLIREARTAASIGNPHIVQVLDVGMAPNGAAFLAMEFLDGPSLEVRLRERGAMPVPQACDIALQLLDALDAAHNAGVVHRDLKPENVLLIRWPDHTVADRDFVKIVDFGISRILRSEEAMRLTRTGVMLGTPDYMAPEQFSDARSADHRADLYAAGVMLYRCLSNALPYVGQSSEEMLSRMLTEAPRPLPQVSPWVPAPVVEVVGRAMQRDPAARWPRAADFAHALRSAVRPGSAMAVTHSGEAPSRAIATKGIASVTASPQPGSATPAGQRAPRRTAWILAAIAVASVVVGGGGTAAYFALRDDTGSDSSAAPPARSTAGGAHVGASAAAQTPFAAATLSATQEVRITRCHVRGRGNDDATICRSVEEMMPDIRACPRPVGGTLTEILITLAPGGQISSASVSNPRPTWSGADWSAAGCTVRVFATGGRRLSGVGGIGTVDLTVHLLGG